MLISCITACGIYDLPAGGCRLASPDEIVPWETGAAVEPAAYMGQALRCPPGARAANDRLSHDTHARGSMKLHPLAGRHVPRDLLVDVDRLQQEYSSRQPDCADSSLRVRFDTSGHRGSSLRGAFNETHILAITQRLRRQIHDPWKQNRSSHEFAAAGRRTG